jgi:hypothetical protein
MDDAMPNAPGVAAEAEAALRRALAARPGDVAVICDLADLLAQTSRGDAASALLAQALRDAPDDASLWFKRGHLAMLAGDLAMARESLERSAALLPGYAPTHQNLGLVAEWSGRLDDAERHFRRALALAPDNLDARFGLGTVLLKARRGDEGWRLYVDGGRRGPGAVRRIPARPWDGAPLDGTLLVDLDQGLGDVLQFIRFAAEARARVERLVVFCDDYFTPLRTLLGSSPAMTRCSTAGRARNASPRPASRASCRSSSAWATPRSTRGTPTSRRRRHASATGPRASRGSPASPSACAGAATRGPAAPMPHASTRAARCRPGRCATSWRRRGSRSSACRRGLRARRPRRSALRSSTGPTSSTTSPRPRR